MTSPRQKLIEELKDPEYRHAFVEGHAKDGIATQLRMMRKAAKWEQRDLATRAFGDPNLQSMVSRYENPDYGKYSLSTLLELAAAFDVGLIVRFAPFSELIDWDLGLADVGLIPKNFMQELKQGFVTSKATTIPVHQATPMKPVAMRIGSVFARPVTAETTPSGTTATMNTLPSSLRYFIETSMPYAQSETT